MPKIVDHDERRAHIITAITKIIARDGFDSVTMRGIANEAGYAHGAIARYFPNKQSLLTAAFLHVFNESHERALACAESSRGLESLRRVIKELLPYQDATNNDARVVLAFWDRAAQDPELEALHHQNLLERRALYRSLLEQAEEDDELSNALDIEEAVNRVTVHAAGWQMVGLFVPESATKESLDASVEALIAGLRQQHHIN